MDDLSDSSQADLRKLFKGKINIPTLPQVVMRINSLIQDPDSGTREIGALIAEDAPLAAKVLKIANSAYYGLQGQCVSTEQASTVLGLRVLKNIVTQVAVMKQFSHVQGSAFSIEDLWTHSLQTAQVCSMLAKKASNAGALSPEEFYVCGLLHDVGKIVMLDNMADEYDEAARMSLDRNLPLWAVERRKFGFTHTDVGAMLASRWDLPEPLANAIKLHHSVRGNAMKDPVVALVSSADVLCHCVAEGNMAAASAVLGSEVSSALGISPAAVDEVVAFAAANTEVTT